MGRRLYSSGVSPTACCEERRQVGGFAMSSTTLYAADQWSPTFASAPISDPTKWTTFPAPALRSSQGAPIMAHDEDHHLLYASTWPDGLWRIVKP
jgi:hypothetical protein